MVGDAIERLRALQQAQEAVLDEELAEFGSMAKTGERESNWTEDLYQTLEEEEW